MDITNFQLLPPKDWQHFERLCHRLWMRLWNDPNAQLQGRGGQAQQGVDLFGRVNGTGAWHGVQCKSKDRLLESRLTAKDVREEVEKAKAFVPPLRGLIIATSAESDAPLQELARTITETHRAQELFDVQILGWTEIVTRLSPHPDLIALIYDVPTKPPPLSLDAQTDAKFEARHTEILDSQATLAEELKQIKQLAAKAAAPAEGPAHGKLDICRALISAHSPRQAIALLETVRDDEWATATASVRFRILTNLGAAYLDLAEHEKGAQYLLDAYAFDTQSEKSLNNRSMALLLLGRYPEAIEAARVAVARYPQNPGAWTTRLSVALRTTPDQALPEVPDVVAADPNVRMVQADALAARGAWPEAESILRSILAALPAASTVKKPDSRQPDRYFVETRLADTLIGRVSTNGMLYAGAPYSAAELKSLREAEELLAAAWQELFRTDLATVSMHIPQHRCAIAFVLGELERAEDILNEALTITPQHAGLLTLKARAAVGRGDPATARKSFAQLPPNSAEDQPLLEAAVLREAKEQKRALSVLEPYIEQAGSTEPALRARCMYAEMLCEVDLANAEARFNSLPGAGTPAVARSTLFFARALREAGREPLAREYLERARAQLTSIEDVREQLLLADALSEFGETQAAVSIYESQVSLAADSLSLREYLRGLFDLDQRQRLAEVLASLPPELAERAHYQYVAGNLAVRTGRYAAARAHFERYLAQNLARNSVRLQWASVCMRLNDVTAVEAWLADVDVEASEWRLEDLIAMGALYNELTRPEDAARVFYQARRRFPNEERAHLAFSVSVLFKSHASWKLAADAAIGPDMVVALQDEQGQQSTYIIEDRSEGGDLRGNETSVHSALGTRLLGKRAGEKVITYSSPSITHERTIVWVKHKYVHALHETLSTFNTRFPDADGLVGFQMPATGTPEERLAPVLQAVARRSERLKQVLESYRQQAFPVSVVGHFLGHTPSEMWRTMLGQGEPIQVCLGNAVERDKALKILEDGSRRFMLEPISLLQLHAMSMLDVAEKVCGKLGIAQETLEELRLQIRHERLHPDGYFTLSMQGEQRLRAEISPEGVARERKRYEEALAWAEAHCEIVPASPKKDIAPDLAEHLTLVGDATYETLLAANGGGFALLSDDANLRALAREAFDVEGVWVQPVLMTARKRGVLRPDGYDQAVALLCSWQHRFTSVNAANLIYAAAQGQWQVSATFRDLAATLSLRTSDFHSNLGVVVEFLQLLWNRRWPIPRLQADALTYAVLVGVDAARAENCVRYYETLGAHVAAGQLSFTAWQAVTDWYRGHFLPPVVGGGTA